MQNTRRSQPLIVQFLQPYPYARECDTDLDGVHYDHERQLNVDADGHPLYCNRTRLPPTLVTTPGRVLPSGYTRSGKWKPAKSVPAKMDRRAGK